jgi:dTDP-4-dehydrorhamnose 3,5-epimerase
MKISVVKSLEIEEIKVIRFDRFCDHRGYFTEHFCQSDFHSHPDLNFVRKVDFVQCNESYSKKGTVRGLHFQWNPFMGKLVRTIWGRMIDMVLDIRKGSPALGKIILYDMPADPSLEYHEWIWIPPGFAHGNFFPEKTIIEYFCTGQYSPGCEAGISPLAKDIDWSLCNTELKKLFDQIVPATQFISQKDRNGSTLKEWLENQNSKKFTYDSTATSPERS